MAKVGYARQAVSDFERIVDHVLERAPKLAPTVVSRITEAVSMLEAHPLVGRRVRGSLRELVISQGRTGYVALYRYDRDLDRVLVLAVRHQREAGFADD